MGCVKWGSGKGVRSKGEGGGGDCELNQHQKKIYCLKIKIYIDMHVSANK